MSRFTDKLLLEENYIDYVSLVYVTESDNDSKEENSSKPGFFKSLWLKFLKFIDWLCKKAKQFKDWIVKMFKKIFKKNKEKQEEEKKQRKSDGEDNVTPSSNHILRITEDKLEDIKDLLDDLYDASNKTVERLKRLIDSQDGEIDFNEERIREELKIDSFKNEFDSIINNGKNEGFTLPEENDRLNKTMDKIYDLTTNILEGFNKFISKIQKECDKIAKLVKNNSDDLEFSEDSLTNIIKITQFITKSLTDMYGTCMKVGQDAIKDCNLGKPLAIESNPPANI